MAGKDAVKKRREEVFSLVQQGVGIEQLANTYGLTTRQIENDLTVIRKAKAVDYSKIDLQGRLSEYNESARQRMTRIWAIISDKAATRKEITNALRLLQKEEELRIGRDQMAGILPKSDVSLNFNQFNLNSADSIKIEFQDIIEIAQPEKVIDIVNTGNTASVSCGESSKGRKPIKAENKVLKPFPLEIVRDEKDGE